MRRRFQFMLILSLNFTLDLALPCHAGQTSKQLPGQSATLLSDGRLLLIGGEGTKGPLPNAAILNTQSGAITPLSSELHQPRAWHTATTLPDGTILVFGGVGSDGQVERIPELFDPSKDRFERLPPIGIAPRAYHTATLLTDGRVLFAGGLSESGDTLGTIELWDWRTNSATSVPIGLLVPRSKHTSTLLATGAVLMWGGVDKTDTPLSFGEVFDPVMQRTTLETGTLSPSGVGFPPRLEASLPPDRSTNVPANAFVALRFSKPLSVVTVNNQSVTLSGPQGLVQANIVPGEGGMLAFVTPGSALLSGTTYTLSLSGLSDATSSLNDTSFSFTTAGTPSGKNGQTIATGVIPDDTGNQALNSQWRDLPPLEAPFGVTAVAGQVLRLNGLPLENVTLSIGGLSASTDTTGRFVLSALSAGHQVMLIDGRTANGDGATYGVFEVGVELTVAKTNILPYTIWMPKLDMAHAVNIPSPTLREMVITTPLIPGLELHLPPHTVIRDHEGKVATQMSITPIPLDRPPFPLARGVIVPIYFTIQPGSGYVEVQNPAGPRGAWLLYPNSKNAPSGTRFDFWNYDPDQKGWYIYGKGAVQPNGKQVVPDPGAVIYEFSGAMVAPPSLAPNQGPAPGSCNGTAGDPVDCGTGLFVLNKTDLFLPDVIPIKLTRTYRPVDSVSRAFGIGTTHPYDIFLVGDTLPWTFTDLVLPDGGRIHYKRISPGTGFTDAVYQNTSSPTIFYGSTISWNPNLLPSFAFVGGWELKLKNGTVLGFPDSEFALVPEQAGLAFIRDRYGNVLQLTRDDNVTARGTLRQITSPNGRWIHLTYDASNRITQAQDNTGRVVIYIYDSQGRLATVKDPNGGQTIYTYDASNRMLSITDARGIVHLTNQYDSKGRVVKQTLADKATYQFKYNVDAGGNIIGTDVTDPRGIVRKVSFNSAGYVLTDTRALGKPEQQTMAFDRQADTNLLLGVTDPLGRKTSYTYDAMANVSSITRLSGTSNAATKSFTYEPQFNGVTSITDPLKHVTSLSYDDAGNPTTISDPLAHRWTLAYNGAGQLVSVTDPLENTTQFSYAAGDLVGITDALGHTQTRVVDAAGRTTALTDPLGNTTEYFYDSLGRLTQVTDPLQGLTKLSYDPNGNILSVTDPRKNASRYAYDNMDRRTSRTDPLLRTEHFQYDLAGNLTQFTDRRGKTTTLSYDDLNRIISLAFASESTITNTYDQGNRLTKAFDSLAGVIARTYDGLDRLTSETTSQGTVTYAHDIAGRRTSMIVTGLGEINYAYDDANRLTKITQGSSTVSLIYDAASRRAALRLPNGVVATYAYDRASRLTELSYQLGTVTVGNLAYTYDDAGRRTSIGGSMARAALPEVIDSATYDAANELTKLDTAHLTYDADGNLIGDGVNDYAWNTRGQLVEISSGSRPFAMFQYDAVGRRLGKTISGLTTHFLYDGPNVVQELAGTKTNLLTGLTTDEIFGRTDAVGSRTFLTDALGSTLALTDAAGKVQTQYMYGPFGDTILSAPSTNSFQYTGRENDGTGLYYYRARYYSPAYNRFISQDPLGLARSRSDYVYAFNNPINRRDPAGLLPLPWFGPSFPPTPENAALLAEALTRNLYPENSPFVSPLAYEVPAPVYYPYPPPGGVQMLGYPIEEAIPVGASNVSPFAYEVEAPVPGAAAEVGAVEGATGYLGAAATGAAIGAGVAAVLFAGYAFYSASCTLQ
jgi:RHS repeat-associated protein